MQVFKDKSGNAYEIEITAGSCAKRLKANLNVNILEPTRDAERIFELMSSSFQIMEAVWVLVQKEALELLPKLTEEEIETGIESKDLFWDTISQEGTADAINGFKEELRNFILSLGGESTLRQYDRATEFESRQRDLMVKQIEEMGSEKMAGAVAKDAVDQATQMMNQRLEESRNRRMKARNPN